MPQSSNSVPLPKLGGGGQSAIANEDMESAGDPSTNQEVAPNSPFLQCAIPKVIYKNAVNGIVGQLRIFDANNCTAIPNYDFRARFLEIARKFANTEQLLDFISHDIVTHFAHDEKV